MNVLVIGASRGTGLQTVRLALGKGHQVTAISRYTSPLKTNNGSLWNNVNVRVIRGDVLSPATFEEDIQGKDVVISSIGVTNTRPTNLYSVGMTNIIRGMVKHNVSRLICVSGVGVEVTPGMSLPLKLATRYIVQRLLKNNFADLLKMEALVKQSDLNWTIVRAPRLRNIPLTGRYRVSANDYLSNPLTIGREDLAHFIVNNIDNSKYFCACVEIAY